MIATLIGSTGLTGLFLVRQLLADSAITKVISISRKSLKVSNAKLTEVLNSDLAELPSIQSKIRGETYFCCLGTTIKAAGRIAQTNKDADSWKGHHGSHVVGTGAEANSDQQEV